MGHRWVTLGSCLLGVVLGGGGSAAGGEIFGTVVGRDGSRHTGTIRWGNDEAFWDETLDGYKDAAIETPVQNTVDVFGVTLLRWTETRRQDLGLAIPFGRIARLEPDGARACRVTLRGGTEIRVRSSGSDVGSGGDGISIDEGGSARTELPWEEIRSIEFAANPAPGRDAERLYGTVYAAGRELTGFVRWDRDESMRDDVLDGDERKIAFRDIAEIARDGARAATVRTVAGETVRLTGTNDVDHDNRGIEVRLPDGRRVTTEWETFERVVFAEAPPSPRYAEFGEARTLSGTVRGVDGTALAGEIAWDLDERWDFETLEGEDADGLEHAVPLALVREIRRVTSEASDVELRSGPTLRLRGTNDVDDNNRGIRVTPAGGSAVELPWSAVARVTFR